MLFGKHGGGYQDGHLIAILDHLEGGADRHLGLAVADIAADQPVHRPFAGKIAYYIADRLILAGGLVEGEGFLQFVKELPGR
ncbi:MAG: hypothetical protein ACD_75C01803G0003 [uncultured bacterium]|nr:MAG: hypothetical protein ACD_75C01803G0003 [uncultured bacterium]